MHIINDPFWNDLLRTCKKIILYKRDMINVKELSEQDFNLFLEEKLDILWKQQKGEPYFYLVHK